MFHLFLSLKQNIKYIQLNIYFIVTFDLQGFSFLLTQDGSTALTFIMISYKPSDDLLTRMHKAGPSHALVQYAIYITCS
jgi:hypothetical protein